MDWLEIILKIIECSFDQYLVFMFISWFAKVRDKITHRQAILINILTILCACRINMLENTYINLFVLIAVYWCYITIIFDLNIKRRLIYFCIAYPIAAGCEILFPILSPDTSYYMEKGEVPHLAENLLPISMTKLVTFVVFIIIRQVAARPMNRVNNKMFFAYLCLPISTFGMMITMNYSGLDLLENYLLKAGMMVFLIFMLISNIFIFYVYTKHVEEAEKNMDNTYQLVKKDAELQHLLHINSIYEQHQMLVHDVGNYLKVLEELVKSNQVERAYDILKELNSRLGNRTLTAYSNHAVLNMLLSEKKEYASEFGVHFDVYVEPNILIESVSDTDMIAMLGNLIDNGVRAAADSDGEKKVKVRIFMQNDMQVLVIKVVNDYQEKPMLEDNRFVSTKTDEGIHGLGIRSVEKAAKQYGGYLECFVKEEEKEFQAILVLPIENI